jgi:hypothetical protein
VPLSKQNIRIEKDDVRIKISIPLAVKDINLNIAKTTGSNQKKYHE